MTLSCVPWYAIGMVALAADPLPRRADGRRPASSTPRPLPPQLTFSTS